MTSRGAETRKATGDERPREGGPDQSGDTPPADPAKQDSATVKTAPQKPTPGRVVLTGAVDPATNAQSELPALVMAQTGEPDDSGAIPIRAWRFGYDGIQLVDLLLFANRGDAEDDDARVRRESGLQSEPFPAAAWWPARS